ncbi:MAG: tRNA (adenosine(37)-N6)-threonylcarbamoyltransferase complex ATPase subunit type 1 TsaE [Candidatus Omnitrophota bacterium]|nr:tRNA (adenosine(37)-N6)-threonylcarbamoyltransferase complex ATPase subunit type 1 TsaE [Candidatus Omnitrophota bacterium]
MRLVTRSVSETKELGAMIARSLKPSDIVALFGELGSGKTVLVKGIAEALGIKSDRVVSPTFVLIREYKAKIPLYHFDLYRLKKINIQSLGFDEYFYGNGISVIEWADRIEWQLPKGSLRIKISIIDKNKRLFTIKKPALSGFSRYRRNNQAGNKLGDVKQ